MTGKDKQRIRFTARIAYYAACSGELTETTLLMLLCSSPLAFDWLFYIIHGVSKQFCALDDAEAIQRILQFQDLQ